MTFWLFFFSFWCWVWWLLVVIFYDIPIFFFSCVIAVDGIPILPSCVEALVLNLLLFVFNISNILIFHSRSCCCSVYQFFVLTIYAILIFLFFYLKKQEFLLLRLKYLCLLVEFNKSTYWESVSLSKPYSFWDGMMSSTSIIQAIDRLYFNNQHSNLNQIVLSICNRKFH